MGFVKKHKKLIIITTSISGALSLFILFITFAAYQTPQPNTTGKHIITVYDRGEETVFLSDEDTVGTALKTAGIELDSHDAVEPGLDAELIADNYWINIYRARPVTVIEGTTRVRTITPYQTPQRIAKDVGITLLPEDGAVVTRSDDYAGEGAGLELTVLRSVPIQLDLYGRMNEIRTLGKTVGDMLKEKGISLGNKDRTSVAVSTPITPGMNIRVWREGKQTISIDEVVPYETEKIQDADRLVGYKAVDQEGKDGVHTVSYEVEIKDGVEVSRTQIAQIVTKQPTKRVEVVGIKSYPNALTKSKGAQYFTDSKGISHRETYYDLDMGVVMQSCGQGGYYEIRIDGVKIDRDGYAIVAANYGRYPKCTVVETSVGPAKVYDTGGFAQRHPEGFDIATDWTNYNGR